MDSIDKLLNSIEIFGSESNVLSFREFFISRLENLDLNFSNACGLMGIESRTLNGIIDGTLKQFDTANLIKISNFLNIGINEVFTRYYQEYSKLNPNINNVGLEKILFIKENFDLSVLKKAQIIEDINDYKEIEEKILKIFSLKSIFEYRPYNKSVAFSSGKPNNKNSKTKDLWVKKVTDIFNLINNPNSYNKELLLEFFPEIKSYSRNVSHGFINLIRRLYQFGINVIYVDSLPTLNLRGATFFINEKPCIVITDYKGFYPTLFFALVHELYHVLFDLNEIKENKYHLTLEEYDNPILWEKENDANEFSRKFLFSKEKTLFSRNFLNDEEIIDQIAKENSIHVSFVYLFSAIDFGEKRKNFWNKVHKFNPSFENIKNTFQSNWNTDSIIDENYLKNFYKTIIA